MRNITAVFVVLVLITVSCSLFKDTDQQRFNAGLKALKSGDKIEALEIFTKIDSVFKNSPYGLYGRAIYYTNEKLEIRAMDAYYNLIKSHPDFIPAYKSFVSLASSMGRDRLTLSLIKQYKNLENDIITATILEIEILISIGEFDKARELLDMTIPQRLDNSCLLMADAELELHTGDIGKALETCRKAINEDDNNTKILLAAGDLYATAGLIDSAASFYNRTLELSRNDIYLKADIAEAMIDIRYFYRASQIINELSQTTTGLHRLDYLKMRYLFGRSKYYDALFFYQDITPRLKHAPSPLLYLAEIRLMLGDVSNPNILIENAGAIAMNDSLDARVLDCITIRQIQALLDIGNWGMAYDVMYANKDFLPNEFGALYEITRAYFAANKLENAFKSLENLRSKAGNNPKYLAGIGKIYESIDSLNCAMGIYDSVLIKDRINLDAILGKITVFKKGGDYSNAFKFLDSLDRHILLNKYVAAEKLSLCQLLNRTEEALDLAVKLIATGPEDIERYHTGAELAMESGDTDIANEIVRGCLVKNPDNQQANLFAGNHYLVIGNNAETQKQIDKLLLKDSSDAEAFILLGQLNETQDQVDSAMAAYRKAIDANKQNGKAYGCLAKLMIDNDLDINQIPNYVRQAQKYSKNPDNSITMGRVNYKKGNYKAAGRNFSKALKEDPDNPIYNYYAGMNLIKYGQPKTAGKHLRKAIINGLSDIMKTNAEEALRNL